MVHSANKEPFKLGRVTTRDVTDFRDYLRREKGQAVATVNRTLVTIRRFFGWLADQGHITANPAKTVKELRRQQLAPKGLDRSQVRRLLREVELRADIRANAIFSPVPVHRLPLSDLVNLELADLMLSERSGTVVFRLRQGQQATVGAFAASSPPCPASLPGYSPASRKPEGVHR